MPETIDVLRLKTAAHTSGLDLPIGPWETTFEANPGPAFIRQSDWSGGIGMKLLPKEEQTTNMAWLSTCWTATGDEVMSGPLQSAVEGTALTGAAVRFFTEEPGGNKLYCSCGTKKYSISGTSGPTQVDAAHDNAAATTITDICLSADQMVVSYGTSHLARIYTFSTTTWGDSVYKSAVVCAHNGAYVWASHPTSGHAASYFYWGATGALSLLIGDSETPITNIVEFNGSLIVFKSDGMYLMTLGSTYKAMRIASFLPKSVLNGTATAIYNGCLFFNAGDNLWRWTGSGMPQRVPTPIDVEVGQMSKVYSLCSIGDALLVGFKGWTLIMVQDPLDKPWFWWHYLARHQSKPCYTLHYTSNIGLTYPRIFYGLSGDSTNNLQYSEFGVGDFRPRTFAASSYIVFPGIFTGPETYPLWVKNINYGTRDCAASKTVAWSYATSAPTVDTTFTSLGDATTSNGFQTLTPASDVNAYLLWLRVDMATNSSTVSPKLDYYGLRYYPRSPARRVWTFPVLLGDKLPLPSGGKQLAVGAMETALVAARNQTNPCTISIPSQGITDQKVFVDFRWTTTRTDVKRADVRREGMTLICREAV